MYHSHDFGSSPNTAVVLFEPISDSGFVIFGVFLESILSPGTRLGAALHLSYFEVNFKGQKGKERKELHLTS